MELHMPSHGEGLAGGSLGMHGALGGDPAHVHHWDISEHGNIHDKSGEHIGTIQGNRVVDHVSGHGLEITEHGELYRHGEKVGKVEHHGDVYKVVDQHGNHIATVSAGHHQEGVERYAKGALAMLRAMHH